MASSILCPVCRTSLVSAPSWSFKDRTVTVPTCGCSASVSVTLKVTGIADLDPGVTTYRHRDGLVVFAP